MTRSSIQIEKMDIAQKDWASGEDLKFTDCALLHWRTVE